MKILSGQTLVDTVRKLADNAEERLWIAVPYLGTYETVQEILGSSWLTKHKISFKLLTDLNELNSVSASSIMLLKKRGLVCSLLGLHAKIYVIDNYCIIGSANLTRTSFTKRYEAAILFSPNESQKAIELFEEFWGKGKKISDTELQIQDNKRSPKEDEGFNKGLVTLSKLHKTSFIKEERLGKKYLSFNSIVEQFKDFTKKYEAVIGKRLWNDVPIYYEIDSFLDYLFAHATRKPSHPYKYIKGRTLNTREQTELLKKYVSLFKEHVRKNNMKPSRNKKATSVFQKNLSLKNYNTLKWGDIQEMLWFTNAGGSQPINIHKATNPKNNKLSLVRQLLYNLVNGEEQLEWRMYECDTKLYGISSALMNEFLHFHNPDIYPLINLRSCSGLRFFGYQINEHRASKKKPKQKT
jgi:hypothetical protein